MTLNPTDITYSWTGINDPFLTGVTDLMVGPDSHGGLLYTSTRAGNAGLAAWAVTPTGLVQRATADLPAATATGTDGGLVSFMLADAPVLMGWGMDGAVAYALDAAGALTSIDLGPALPADLRALDVVELDGDIHLYASRPADRQIDHWVIGDDGKLVELGAEDALARVGQFGLMDLAQVEAGDMHWIVGVGDGFDTIISYDIEAGGLLRRDGRIAPADGPGVEAPSVVATAVIEDVAYVLVGGGTSNSLSVFTLNRFGNFTPVDHVLDSRDTRFAAIDTLEVRVVAGATYVLAAGNDDGLTVLQLLPGGRLAHLVTFEDRLDLGLSDLSAAILIDGGDHLGLAATSATEGGLTWIEIATGIPGQTHIADDRGGALAGGAGDDVLAGGAGADAITGGAGADILMDGAGADTLTGGAGADTFVFDPDGAMDRITDFERGIDRLDLSGWMFLRNEMQLQIVTRADGADITFGDEVLRIDSADGTAISRADLLAGGVIGLDRILPAWMQEDEIVIPAALEPDLLQVGGDGDDTLTGTDEGDRLVGGGGGDALSGGAGADTLEGGDGADTLDGGQGGDDLSGGAGADRLTGGDGTDTLSGGAGDDQIAGGAGADRIDGGAGDDVLAGGDADDTLTGGEGADTLDGGRGADRMAGGTGDDLYRIDDARDRIDEAPGHGTDTIRATAEVTLAEAEVEYVLLEGAANLRVNGNHHATEIVGNSGSNILIGGGGGDVLTGGAGRDYFAFLTTDAPGATRITDFGGRDQLALDDRFFGLGDGRIDVREVTPAQVTNALRSGAVSYDNRTGELWIDSDGRGGPARPELVAILDGGPALWADDVLLF